MQPSHGRPFRSPREYFTHNEPDGVGTTEETVLKLIGGTPAEALWREQVTPKKGGERWRKKETEQFCRLDNDIVIIKPERPAQGNSRAYIMQRLRSERPDLAARVDAGEVVNGRRFTAHVASGIAGWIADMEAAP